MSGTMELVPLVPLALIVGFAAVTTILCVIMGWRGGPGAFWRFVAAMGITVMLLNPRIVDEQREPQSDVVALVVDRTASQKVGERPAQTETAVAHVRERLARLPQLDVRETTVRDAVAGTGQGDGEGSLLLGALRNALGGIPRQRVAGAILVTDGQAHDPALIDEIEKIGA
ncbi:MAG: hypothetical protein OXR84_11880, partial [Magnetovibrio sp.]|nr:hypothetical protein [Magnetovibrio sp.]